jgi:putative flippase GtrA
MVGAVALVATMGAATVSHADTTLTAFAIAGGTTSGTNVSYTPGAGGGLVIGTASGFLQGKLGQGYAGNATVSFDTLTNGTYTFNSATGAFDQLLNPLSRTTFTITDNGTGTVLLSGSFGSADLTGYNGASSGNVNLTSNSVIYTGGTFFPNDFAPNNGSLSIEFTSTNPFVANASGLSAFIANDGITFSARPTSGNGGHSVVPEPSTTASFALGAFGLLGLLLRGRRGRKLQWLAG